MYYVGQTLGITGAVCSGKHRFWVRYIVCGFVGYTGPVELLPIVGALFNMPATFQRDVQKTRVLLLINVSFFPQLSGTAVL